jgi:hypothetical protein
LKDIALEPIEIKQANVIAKLQTGQPGSVDKK